MAKRAQPDDSTTPVEPTTQREYLSTTTKASGALFSIDEVKESGPLMSGSFEIDGEKVPVSGFVKIAKETGLRYLSLALGHEGKVHYYGKLFRQDEAKRYPKSPDYHGFIAVLPSTDSGQYTSDEWNAAPTLQVCGWRKRNADGGSRIALTLAPATVADDELPF